MGLTGSSRYKAEKGLIKIKLDLEDGKISKITITGDFFFYPEDKLWDLEKTLIGCKVEEEKLTERITEFYRKMNVSSPGVKPEDFTKAITLAVDSALKG